MTAAPIRTPRRRRARYLVQGATFLFVAALPCMATASASANPAQEGIAAARAGREADAERWLAPFVHASGARPPAKATRYLSFIYAHRGDYAAAAALGERALAARDQDLSGNDLDQFTQDVAFWKANAKTLPQETRFAGETTLPLAAGNDERMEVMLSLGGSPARALIDTGAEYTVISQSLASRLRLALLPAGITDKGSTGQANTMRLAVLEALPLGSASVRHLPVMVADDAAMVVGKAGHQQPIDLIVGYAVLRTLRSIELTERGTLRIGGPSRSPSVVGRLAEDGFVAVVSARALGSACDLLLDTGANHTILSRDFLNAHPALATSLAARTQAFTGIGGSAQARSLRMPSLDIALQSGSVHLEQVAVFPDPSQFDVQGLAGNGGRDLWRGRRWVRLDFEKHRLEMGPLRHE